MLPRNLVLNPSTKSYRTKKYLKSRFLTVMIRNLSIAVLLLLLIRA